MAAERLSIPPHKAALIMCKAFYIKLLLKRLEDIMQAIWSMGGGNFAVSNKKALYKLPTHTRQYHRPKRIRIIILYAIRKVK